MFRKQLRRKCDRSVKLATFYAGSANGALRWPLIPTYSREN